MTGRRATLLVLAKLWILANLSSAQSPPTPGATVSASGIVFLTPEDRPIRHARVELLISSKGWFATSLTDDDGGFKFKGLVPASYHVTVTALECERLE